MIKHLLVACILLALFGCASDQIRGVHKGMTKSQVIAFVGKPDGSQRSGQYEALQYSNRLISDSSTVRADYYVILQSGLVIEYGYGYVRQRDPTVTNKLILVPLDKGAE